MTNKDLHRKYQRETGRYHSENYSDYTQWIEERYIALSNDLVKLLEKELSELFNKEIKIEI